MKALLTVSALAVVLTGCVNYDRLRATAPNAASYELCRAGMTHADAQVRAIAWQELQNRQENCSQFANAIAAERAANAQQAANSLAIMQMLQPPAPAPMPMPAPPTTVRCNSYSYGNQTQTTCR